MKKRLFVFIILSIGVVQAQSYKCEQANGSYLYSDKPCAVTATKAPSTLLDENGRVINLANDGTPIPLPTKVVKDLFDNVEQACKAQDGETLLAQFSQTMQQDIKLKSNNKTVFETMSPFCSKMKVIKEELAKSSEQTLFASKMPNKATLLCFYKETQGLDRCIGNILITAENDQLKLNGF